MPAIIPTSISVPSNLLEKIVNYLSERPYREAIELITPLQQAAQVAFAAANAPPEPPSSSAP